MTTARKGGLCSESSRSADKTKTCYSRDDLVVLSRCFNRTTRGEKIRISGASRDSLLRQLRSRLKPLCDTERCWLGAVLLSEAAEERMDLSFAPTMPESWKANPTEWLSNEDIEQALKRHTAHHKDFSVLGVFPMDFMGRDRYGRCVSDLCGFRAKDVFGKGVKKAAIVLNTDTHTGRGKHWVAVFIHACPTDKRYGIYYFDSTGRAPTPEVDRFADLATKQLVGIHGGTKEPAYAFNDYQHQLLALGMHFPSCP